MEKKIYLIISFIAGGLGILFLSALIIFEFTSAFSGLPFINVLFIILTSFFLVTFIYFLSRYNQQLTIDKTVELENLHTLGKKSNLFNLYAFERMIQKLRYKPLLVRKKQYVVAFTGTSLSITQNINRSQNVSDFISLVVDVLNNIFNKNSSKIFGNRSVFCFNRGIFFIYLFVDDQKELTDLISLITKELYERTSEKNINIWVQPFFGVAETNSDDNLIEIIENASLSRNQAEKNFETISYYDPSFRKTSNIDDVVEILDGLKNNEFVVFYQPKFNLNTGRFDSSEALVRWDSPKYGFLPPNRFIPKAELGGIVHELDTYVFTKVCEDLKEFKRRGRRVLPVSVNFSLFEFYDAAFMNKIFDTLDDYKIEPELIQIEITETTSLANPFMAVSIIKKMKDKGIKVLMDDFGVGFSEIGNLRTIPFDGVKIDKTFADVIETDQKTYSLVKMLITMCHESGIEVICEGVSNKNQIEILKRLRCDVIQGYYYSKALAKRDYMRLLETNKFERKAKE